MKKSFPLYQQYKLIEKNEDEINGAWKGAHLLLFFLAFIFGSFCTFCFHMLMYMFDEKCVLFPKILSLSSINENLIYDFLPEDKDKSDSLPVDFLTTQWVEKSACFLPTYVPLVSGIFGLVWTTMFLMCSSGSRTLTGLQRPYRVLPPVFLFSLAMGVLCVYSSIVTHTGLYELCYKLNEATGSSDTSCTYTVNVATLVYERRIRGVYQATRLTIVSAWLHTACWLLSACLIVIRVLLAVDFYLVRINVDLVGDMDRMVERHEVQLQAVSPNTYKLSPTGSGASTKVHFQNKSFSAPSSEDLIDKKIGDINSNGTLYIAKIRPHTSELSLVPEERNKLSRLKAYNRFPKAYQFIVKLVHDLVDSVKLPVGEKILSPAESESMTKVMSPSTSLSLITKRQLGQSKITYNEGKRRKRKRTLSEGEAEEIAMKIRKKLEKKSNMSLDNLFIAPDRVKEDVTIDISLKTQDENSDKERSTAVKSELENNKTNASKESVKKVVMKKPNLKHKSVQTDESMKKTKSRSQKVYISESKTSYFSEPSERTITEVDKEVQTSPRKEKQD